MAYYTALIAKWGTLSGTTAAKLTAINALTVVGPSNPVLVQTYRIYNVIDPTEFTALAAANQALVRDILTMGTVDASTGTNVRTRLLAVFTAAAAPLTRAALTALAATFDTTIPWWQATVAQGGGGLTSTVSASDLTAAGGLT